MTESATRDWFRVPMVERVAKAICRAAGDDPDREARDACDPMNDGRLAWEVWVDEAQAAIAAMREPNLAMRKVCSFEDAEITWPAMIDAALSKSTPTQKGE